MQLPVTTVLPGGASVNSRSKHAAKGNMFYSLNHSPEAILEMLVLSKLEAKGWVQVETIRDFSACGFKGRKHGLSRLKQESSFP